MTDDINNKATAGSDKLDDIHQDTPSSRPLSPGHNKIGLLAELAFEREFGLPHKGVHNGRHGDGGLDYTLVFDLADWKATLTVDVKGARYSPLLVEQRLPDDKKVYTDLYVLARPNADETDAWLVGWCTKATVLSYPPLMGKKGIINHTVPVNKLRDIRTLKERHVK